MIGFARSPYRAQAMVFVGITALALTGCGEDKQSSPPNPATMTKEQRVQSVDNDPSLTPEQKAAKRAQIEELEKQTQAARSMGSSMAAPAGLKK